VSLNYLRYLFLAHLSKPASDRVIYRAVRRVRPRRILEIGIGSADRTVRLARLASRQAQQSTVRYAAIDPFEARDANLPAGLSLKEAHRLLTASGVQAQLVPGDPAQAISRAANSLAGMDLVLISADYEVASLGQAWFYVPRMLHAGSRVYIESRQGEGGLSYRLMTATEIEQLAGACRRRAA
jgi:hypothetical protein